MAIAGRFAGSRDQPPDLGWVKYSRALPTEEFTMVGDLRLVALKAMIIRTAGS
jgi:hypothetical protein